MNNKAPAPSDGRELLKEGQYAISPPGDIPASVTKPSWADDGRWVLTDERGPRAIFACPDHDDDALSHALTLSPSSRPALVRRLDRMPQWDNRPQVHSPDNLVKMRAACTLAAEILNMAGEMVKPGVTTEEIDRAVHKAAVDAGAYPSPLNYGGFPKSVCTSVNECICHGIPDARPLKEGDIVNIDVTVFLNGYHGDTSRMFKVGKVSDTASSLCKATTEALMAGIGVCKPGVRFAEIGKAIQGVADSYGYTSSKSFVGHGVGTVFHAYPHILHYRNNEPGVMKAGMTFTIEPMLCEKSAKEVFWKDGWTAVTKDAGLSAQQEHTILITDDGSEILTVAA
jgi:methionyl aminopeptidase